MIGWLQSFFRSLLPEEFFLNGEVRPLPRRASVPAAESRSPSLPSRTVARPAPITNPRAIWRDWVQRIVIEQAEGVVIPDSLSLAKLRLCALPAHLTVMGSLDLRQCQRLRQIGPGLTVQGDLQIGGHCGTLLWYESSYSEMGLSVPLCRGSQPPLRWIPAALQVQGDLILRQCHRLTGLPPDSKFNGLHIEGCHRFLSLPEELTVQGSLTLQGCPKLQTLPDRLHVGGDLKLVGLAVKSLPQQLHVGRDLILECLPHLTELPKNLVVGRHLIIRRCPLTMIPESVKIPGSLTVRHCDQLESLPDTAILLENLTCHDCPKLASVPPSLKVRRSLRLTNCMGLTSLPVDLTIPHTLDVRGCKNLTSLPGLLKIGFDRDRRAHGAALNIVDCEQLRELPSDLAVAGPIDLAGSGILDAPPMAWNLRLLWRGFQVESDVVFHPERLTPERILNEPNAEIRRLMLDRVGCESLLRRVSAQTVDEDRDPGGERRLVDINVSSWTGEPHRFLMCRCPSTGRTYPMRVPPTVTTCHAAAAWLAGFDDPDAYRPLLET